MELHAYGTPSLLNNQLYFAKMEYFEVNCCHDEKSFIILITKYLISKTYMFIMLLGGNTGSGVTRALIGVGCRWGGGGGCIHIFVFCPTNFFLY